MTRDCHLQTRSPHSITRLSLTALLLASATFLSGCANDAQNGALLGGMLGAGTGAIIGHNSGDRSWSGAGIGAAAGALGGYIVGNEIDKGKQAKSNNSRYDY